MSNLENINNNAAQHDNNNDGPPPPQHVQLPPQQNNNDHRQIPTSNFWGCPLTQEETLEQSIIDHRAIGAFPIPYWRNLNPNPNDKEEMKREDGSRSFVSRSTLTLLDQISFSNILKL